jgi:hypothetical protein
MVAMISTLKKAGVHAQVTETLSTVPYRDAPSANEELDIEAGFHILIFNVQPDEFRFKVWGPLTNLMPVECAHVDTPDYKGCLSNWPGGLFVESQCTDLGVRHHHRMQPQAPKNIPDVTLQPTEKFTISAGKSSSASVEH